MRGAQSAAAAIGGDRRREGASRQVLATAKKLGGNGRWMRRARAPQALMRIAMAMPAPAVTPVEGRQRAPDCAARAGLAGRKKKGVRTHPPARALVPILTLVAPMGCWPLVGLRGR